MIEKTREPDKGQTGGKVVTPEGLEWLTSPETIVPQVVSDIRDALHKLSRIPDHLIMLRRAAKAVRASVIAAGGPRPGAGSVCSDYDYEARLKGVVVAVEAVIAQLKTVACLMAAHFPLDRDLRGFSRHPGFQDS